MGVMESIEDPMPPSVKATVPSVEATMLSDEATVPSVDATVPSAEATVSSVDVTVPSVEATGVPVGTVASILLLSVAVASPAVVPSRFAISLELSSVPEADADIPDESVVATLELGSPTDPSFLICSGVFRLLHLGLFLGQAGKNGGRS